MFLSSLPGIAALQGVWSLTTSPAWHGDAVAEPPPFCTLLSEQGSEGRGNTVTFLTCNNQHDTKEGSLEMPLHEVWKEQWNFQSSSHFEPQQDKGMKNSNWKYKQNLDYPRFV